MKVTITALKAPWPAGAFIGAIVAIAAAELPGCFVGKCTPAPDEAEALFDWAPPAPAEKPQATANGDQAADLEQQLQAERQLRAAAEQSAHEVARMLEAERRNIAGLAAKLADAEAELATLRAAAAAGGELVTNPAGDAGAGGRKRGASAS